MTINMWRWIHIKLRRFITRLTWKQEKICDLSLALPRDRSFPAQPISTRKVQSRKKSPQTFAHLVNCHKSCYFDYRINKHFICSHRMICVCSFDLDVLCAQRIISFFFFISITHKSRFESTITLNKFQIVTFLGSPDNLCFFFSKLNFRKSLESTQLVLQRSFPLVWPHFLESICLVLFMSTFLKMSVSLE